MNKSKQGRSLLKSYYKRNSIPTANNFADLIDGMLNLNDDGVTMASDGTLGLRATGDSASSKNVLNIYDTFEDDDDDDVPAWTMNLNPAVAGSSHRGLSFNDTNSISRLFIDESTGNIGIGNLTPQAPLSISASAGKESHPDESMHITNDSILFGGNNSGRTPDSAQISAGKHVPNSLNIVGMSSETSGGDRKIDVWAEGGLTIRGPLNVSGEAFAGEGLRLGDQASHINSDGALYRTGGKVYLTVDDHLFIRDSSGSAPFLFDTNTGRLTGKTLRVSNSGKEDTPDGYMHITNDTILFGGNNSGKNINSATISAGKHAANSLNIVGMSSGTSGNDRKVDVWAEGGLTIRGQTNTTGGVRFDGGAPAHIDADGSLYRFSGQCYLTVDDNFYIRDNGGSSPFHFNTNNGALTSNTLLLLNTGNAALDVRGSLIRKVVRATGLGPSDNTDPGASGSRINSRTLNFSKRHAGTAIRITYCDNFRVNGNSAAVRWEIRIDGKTVPGGALVFDKYGNEGNYHEMATVFGFAGGIVAGNRQIQIWVNRLSGHTFDSYTGWRDSRWTIEAEEVWL